MSTSQRERFIPNTIGHFEVAGPDVGALASFYGAVFGWNILARGPGYTSVETPPGCANGALIESDEPLLTVGIIVRDLEVALTAARAHGGTVIMPITDNGWVTKAQVADPAGNVFTLIRG